MWCRNRHLHPPKQHKVRAVCTYGTNTPNVWHQKQAPATHHLPVGGEPCKQGRMDHHEAQCNCSSLPRLPTSHHIQCQACGWCTVECTHSGSQLPHVPGTQLKWCCTVCLQQYVHEPGSSFSSPPCAHATLSVSGRWEGEAGGGEAGAHPAHCAEGADIE